MQSENGMVLYMTDDTVSPLFGSVAGGTNIGR